jgi:GT2 family glycosyltransferase
MRKKFQISVLVSCFKTENYLKTFLEELPRQQNFDNIQIVFNLNEPNINEEQWIHQFKKRYPKNIKQIVNNSVVPQSVAWNQCIKKADGDLLAIWNVDDLRTPNSLKSQADAFEKDVIAVHGNFVIVRKFGSRKGNYIDHSYTLNDTQELERSMCLGPFFMFRKIVVNEIGYFDEQLKVAADYDFAIRLAKHGKIGMAAGVLGYFLDEQKGLSTCGDNIQPIERTMVELRYNLTDKIVPQFVPFVKEKGYDPHSLFLDGKKWTK